MASVPNPIRKAKRGFEKAVTSVLHKYGYPPFGKRGRHSHEEERPPYAREVSPYWLRNTSHNNSLINNSIEEKVNQTFRRGFSEWEKEWEAKCPECGEEFNTLEPFKLEEDIEDEEVDLDHPRPCPDCGELANIKTPDPDERERAEQMFQRVNMTDRASELVPDDHNSIAQTYLEVCKEVAWDIQTFDDGWMIFDRAYSLDHEGSVQDWELREVIRAPPYLMRYSIGEDTQIGGEFWVCLECRARSPENYEAQRKPGRCEECGNRTYEVFAKMLDDVNGDPVRYFTRGEFAHGSEYRPRFTYGYSPILSVWQEARTLEQMDEWYQEAYEQRRAPRGAIAIRSSNAESTRAWNTEQMQKLNGDPNHIPTLIDDTEGGGSPIEWQPLLEEPAAMQHMQMREWFLDRVSAKFGVTAVFQNARSESGGMDSSMEIIVSNRSAQRLKGVFDDIFMPAFLGQLQVEGWTRGIARIEEEDEDAKAQRVGKWLNNAQTALKVGADVEWTRDDKADIKPGDLTMDEGEEGGEMGGLGALMGGGDGDQDNTMGGETTPSGGRPDEPNQMGGEPDDPAQNNPFANSTDEKDTVTSGTSGYSHASYGGDPEDATQYLEEVRRQLESDETAHDAEELVDAAKSFWKEVDFGPELSKIENVANQPNKNWQSMRRMGGDWVEDYQKNSAVEQMFRMLQYE